MPRTVAHQSPLSRGFPRQEYWNGLLFPSPGDLPNPGIKPMSPALAGAFFITELPYHFSLEWVPFGRPFSGFFVFGLWEAFLFAWFFSAEENLLEAKNPKNRGAKRPIKWGCSLGTTPRAFRSLHRGQKLTTASSKKQSQNHLAINTKLSNSWCIETWGGKKLWETDKQS